MSGDTQDARGKTLIELRLPADHPAYAGHFPGEPILPGVVLLDAALDAIVTSGQYAPRRWQILAAKFLSVVRPGDALMLEHESQGGAVKWSIRGASGTVASGSFGPA